MITKASCEDPTYPDGLKIAFVHPVDDPSGNGGGDYLDVVNLRTHRTKQEAMIDAYGFDGDSDTTENGNTAGIAWQPATWLRRTTRALRQRNARAAYRTGPGAAVGQPSRSINVTADLLTVD